MKIKGFDANIPDLRSSDILSPKDLRERVRETLDPLLFDVGCDAEEECLLIGVSGGRVTVLKLTS